MNVTDDEINKQNVNISKLENLKMSNNEKPQLRRCGSRSCFGYWWFSPKGVMANRKEDRSLKQ